jgi:hypothetical protein
VIVAWLLPRAVVVPRHQTVLAIELANIALRSVFYDAVRCFVRVGSSTEMTALAFDVGFTLNIRHSFDSSARQFGHKWKSSPYSISTDCCRFHPSA